MGPMWAGKTTELMRQARRARAAGLRCLVIKYEGDTRYDKEVLTTHDQNTMSAVSANRHSLGSIDISNYDIICVDEGQFYEHLHQYVEDWLTRGIRHVYISALNGDFQGKAWREIVKLGPIEHITNLSAICTQQRNDKTCGREAHFTARITQSDELELVGGKETYTATCRECFRRLSKAE